MIRLSKKEVLHQFSEPELSIISDFLERGHHYRDRSKEATNLLHKNIDNYAIKAKTDIRYKAVLLYLLYPKLLKMASQVQATYSESLWTTRLEIGDVFNELYLLFDNTITNYNIDRASFIYYLKICLLGIIGSWVCTQKNYFNRYLLFAAIADSQSWIRPANTPEYLHESNLIDSIYCEFIEYLNKFKAKTSKDRTMHKKYIIDSFFLKGVPVQDIADHINVSYHAIYEFVNRHKKTLSYLYNNNRYGSYYVDSISDNIYHIYDKSSFIDEMLLQA